MADIQAADIRKGMAIVYQGSLYRVLEFEHRTPGNLRAFVQAKLRNLVDGTQRQVKFSATEMLERAIVQTREMDFLYSDGSGYVFMDAESYDQVAVAGDALGEAGPWLKEGMRVLVEVHSGTPIAVHLPKGVEAVVVETEPVVKGQSAARSTKPAKLDNGVVIQVPPFIERGDRIRVDAEEGRYIERAK